MTTNELIEKHGIGHNCLSDAYDLGRADAIDEHFTKIMSFINTNNRGNCDYFIVDQIENYIFEQLKEQKNEQI